jgi:hypothetical protein
MTEYTKIGVGHQFEDRQVDRLFNRVINSINAVSDGFIFSTRAISAAYTAGKSDHCLLVSTASGGVTVTLPAAYTVPFKRYTIKKTTSDANAVTINTGGGNIDNSASASFTTALGVREIVSDGANYWLIN